MFPQSIIMQQIPETPFYTVADMITSHPSIKYTKTSYHLIHCKGSFFIAFTIILWYISNYRDKVRILPKYIYWLLDPLIQDIFLFIHIIIIITRTLHYTLLHFSIAMYLHNNTTKNQIKAWIVLNTVFNIIFAVILRYPYQLSYK